MNRTKINPLTCWVIGWAHALNALVMILSFGFLSTTVVSKVTLWAARLDSKKNREPQTQ